MHLNGGAPLEMSEKQHEKYVAEEFDRAAKGYDKSRFVKSYQRRVQLSVINRLQIRKGMRILDLGCGTGKGCIDIASKLRGTGKVVGIDVSSEMIEQAKKNLAETGYHNIEFEIGSASSLNYKDYFDSVLSTNAFHHFQVKETIFNNVWKVLKHNGVFIVQDFCDDYFLMKIVDFLGRIGEKAHIGSTTSEQLRTLFRSSNFVDVEIEKRKMDWFWGIMVGKGVKRVS
jgi:ubiquinone/menaquinone biosynthesis C-methylase UbiE